MTQFAICVLMALSAASAVLGGPSARCKYQASSMDGYQPEKWTGVWYGDSTSEDVSNLQCGIWNSSLIESSCNNPTGGCSQGFVWAMKEKASSPQYFPGWIDQTAGEFVGSYYGAYYDMPFSHNWYTLEVLVLDTDYNSYAAIYICERDNPMITTPNQVFLYARKKEGLGSDVRNQLFQKLKAKFNWSLNGLNVFNNSNCSFPVSLH